MDARDDEEQVAVEWRGQKPNGDVQVRDVGGSFVVTRNELDGGGECFNVGKVNEASNE